MRLPTRLAESITLSVLAALVSGCPTPGDPVADATPTSDGAAPDAPHPDADAPPPPDASTDAPPVYYALTVSRAGTGDGLVLGPGVDCGINCAVVYLAGTTVELNATPDGTSTFDGWSDACAGTGTCTIVMNAAKQVTASFSTITYPLAVARGGSGAGSVTSFPAGIVCGSTCSANFDIGTTVTLAATPAPYSTFASWSGACSGSAGCTLLMDSTKAVTAVFTQITYVVSVARTGTGGGTVVSDIAGIACGTACTSSFDGGIALSLAAIPDGSSYFVGWSGPCSGSGTCDFLVDGDTNVDAEFATITYPLSVGITGTGGGIVASTPAGVDCGGSCTVSFDIGTVVTLTASPNALSTFEGWSGACSGIGPCVVTMDGTTTVGAQFTKITYPVAVSSTGPGVGTVISTPAGIDCGATCNVMFDIATTLVLTADATDDSRFAGWSGDCTGTSTTCSITVDGPKNVGAGFLRAYLSSARFGGVSGDTANDVAEDGAGDTVVVGVFEGTADFGDGIPRTSAGYIDMFVAKYSGADGTPIWVRTFGGAYWDQALAVAIDAGGDVVVTGYFSATVNFGGSDLTASGYPAENFADTFLVKLSGADGSHIWSSRYGGTRTEFGYDVAADAAGDVFLGAGFAGTCSFGGATFTSAGDVATGFGDIAIAKFSGGDGSHIWSRAFGSTEDDRARAVAVDGAGDLFVTGTITNAVDLGGGVLPAAGGSEDIFLAKYRGTDGAHEWSKRLIGSAYDGGRAIAVDPAGDVIVSGTYEGAVDLGGGTIPGPFGNWDVFVAKYSGTTGSHVWSFGIHGDGVAFNGTDIPGGVATDASGDVYVSGTFQGTTLFPGTTLTSSGGSTDAFVGKFSGSSGSRVWVQGFGSSVPQSASSLAVGSSGAAIVGSMEGSVDFGGGAIMSAGNSDGFLVRLRP